MAHIFGSWPELTGVSLDMFGFGRNTAAETTLSAMRVELARYALSLQATERPIGPLWGPKVDDHLALVAELGKADGSLFNKIIDSWFESPLVFGFSQGPVITSALRGDPGSQLHVAMVIANRLIRLAEAVGASYVRSPEHQQSDIPVQGIDSLYASIQERVGFDLAPPKVNGPIYGLRIGDHYLNERHFDGIYAAWRLKQILGPRRRGEDRVCKIGGGAGYVAYYARKMGISEYYIIDLPTVSITQYIVLAGDFGAENVRFGDHGAPVNLISAADFSRLDFWRFAAVLNIDSMPEMLPETVAAYLSAIRRAEMFLSINQESGLGHGEFNQSIVRDLAGSEFITLYRFPYWLRMGWVEELFKPSRI